MPRTETAILWAFGFLVVWGLLGAHYRATSRQHLSKPTLREQGNAIIGEAHSGYEFAVVFTLVTAYLSPLGETITTVTQTAITSSFPPAFATLLTNFVVLGAYSLLTLVGILVVYLAIRPPYLRTTEKRPSLGSSVSCLMWVSVLHFGPAFVVLLVTVTSNRPILSGLFVSLILVVGVPIAHTLYNRILMDSREATAEERRRVTGDILPSDCDVRVSPGDFDNHRIVVIRRLFERPLVFVGADALADLSDECLRTLLHLSHEKNGWKQGLKFRVPVGVWFGLTTTILVELNTAFLLSVGGLLSSYLCFQSTVAKVLARWRAAVPETLDEMQAAQSFEELGEVQRFPPEAYIEPTADTAANNIDGPETEISDRTDARHSGPLE